MAHESTTAGHVPESRCRNCDTPLEARYCPNCGQKEVDLERPILVLLRELVYETFELDGRALRTLTTLIVRPGALTSEFLAGHRRRFTPPLRLYLVISLLFFFSATWIAGQGGLLEHGQSVEEFTPGQVQFLGDDLPRLMFLLLPLFALLLKLAYFSRLYFDHVIFAVHFHCVAYIVLGLMLPFEQLASRQLLALLLQLLLLTYLCTYLVLALRRVYGSGWLAATLKCLAVLLAYVTLLSATIEAASSFVIISD